MQLANTAHTHTQCILSCTARGKQAARGREGARENRRWEGQGGKEGGEGGGGSKVMVGEGTRGGRERRREGGSKVMVGEGTRGGMERRREGESKGRERGSKDATQARSVSGGREG